MRYLNYRMIVPVVAGLCFLLAMAWVKHRDPFRRIEFSLQTPHYGKVKAIAVLPKPDARYPIVIYVHGWSDSLMKDGKHLRQIAELGLAAVGIEYDQTNAAAFDEQFLALHEYLARQPWAAREKRKAESGKAETWVGKAESARRKQKQTEETENETPLALFSPVQLESGKAEDGSQRADVGRQKADSELSTLDSQPSTPLVAWVGMSLGAQRTLRFILNHPEVQPQLYVRLSGGWVTDWEDGRWKVEDGEIAEGGKGKEENIQHPTNAASSSRREEALIESGRQKAESGKPGQSLLTSAATEPGSAAVPAASNIQNESGRRGAGAPRLQCPVLLVHSDNDTVFPLEDTKRLAALLETNGVSVNLRVLPGTGHDFGADRPLVFRETAEYCREHLPPADYTATLRDCKLNETERRRFNLAMQRAGQNRRELWKAVVSLSEPERRTLMMVIGGLEDYDLAHAKASYLKKHVHMAWQTRRAYPWCRKTPLDVFEEYVAGPRFFQEPIENWRPSLNRLARHEVKYCRTTQEASDKVWKLMNEKVAFDLKESGGEIDPLKILDAGKADCLGLCIMHAALGRSVGLPVRVTRVLWQNSLGEHFCVEVWSYEDQRWHEIDVSAGDRAFENDWVMRVPKTAILASSGERGVWDGLSVGRWSSFTNTISLIYPSGDVSIKVLDHGNPAPDRTVGIKLPTVKGLVYMALARTDLNGEARLTLGGSAQYPYLFFVLPSDEAAVSAKYPFPFSRHQFGDETWQWVQVESGKTQEVVLDLKDRRLFDPNAKPPVVPKPAP